MKIIAFWESYSGAEFNGIGDDIAAAVADLETKVDSDSGDTVPFVDISFFEAHKLDVKREITYFFKRKE